MSEQLAQIAGIEQASYLMARLRDNRAAGAALGVVALGTALIVGLQKDWIDLPGLPNFGSAPDSNSAQAEGKKVVADAFSCRSLGVQDLAGSEALAH